MTNHPARSMRLQASPSDHLASSAMLNPGRALRVALVQPPELDGVVTLLPHFQGGGENFGRKPPLGILYIASLLRAASPHHILLIDAPAENLSVHDTVQRLLDFQPDVVGISAWTDFWFPAWDTAQRLKSRCPDVHLCIGGPHVSIFPHETLAFPCVDSIVVGDGERPFLYLCNLLSNHTLEGEFPGLHFKACGVQPHPNLFHIHANLDELPIPDRTLLPLARYTSVLSSHDFVTTMMTSRGCPHRCTFCKLNFQKTLSHSAQRVVEEFQSIRAMGIREVEIYDDTFTWSKKRLQDICLGLIDAGLPQHVTWAVRDRVSSADPELYDLMYRAGCRRIHLGIESGVQRVIDRMKKNITIQQAQQAVAWAKQTGFTVLTYFMFGNVDESIDDMRQTIAFALALDADYAEFSITIPYAGTEMYEEALQSGIIQHDYWRDYACHPRPGFQPPQLIETGASLAEMQLLYKQAVRAYYFRPRYLIGELVKLKNPAEFRRKARMGLRLLASLFQRH